MLRNLYSIALLATAGVTIACDGKPVPAIPRVRTLTDSADQVMYSAKTTITANGVSRGEITGDTIATFDQLTRFEIIGMRVQFATPLGRPLARMNAHVGRYSLATGTLLTRQNDPVLIQSDTSRRRIDAKAVTYDAEKNQLSSDSTFTATVGARRMTGQGFTADPGLFSVKCKARCVGSLP